MSFGLNPRIAGTVDSSVAGSIKRSLSMHAYDVCIRKRVAGKHAGPSPTRSWQSSATGGP
jgi:hypothetical protein